MKFSTKSPLKCRAWLLGLGVAVGCLAASVAAAQDDEPAKEPVKKPAAVSKAVDSAADKLAVAAAGTLNKYCYRCHGLESREPGLDVSSRTALLTPANNTIEPFILAGNAKESRLWEALKEGRMPPRGQPQPSDEEKEVIKQWINSGASFPAVRRAEREYLGEDTLLAMISNDLANLPQERGRFTRYFSLMHLWNNPNIDDLTLRNVRAGVSKLCNSLSDQFRIAVPRVVDGDGVLLAIDLRDYGWNKRNQWTLLLQKYPYGLRRGTREAQLVYKLSDCDLPYLRADWFLRNASRPPLYHDMINVPKKIDDLETQLGVNMRQNFDNDKLARAAFNKSGVSTQNRLLERHDAKFGAYWKSYDFKANVDRGNLFKFPLGPEFTGRRNGSAFKHDGGEMIWNLPNGMQAYMLALSDGNRIDEGPISIVRDANEWSGTPAIVNGLSCMGCHKHGMIKFADTLRSTFNRSGGQFVAEKVERLFAPKDEMDRLVDDDQNRFMIAMERAAGPFLRTGPEDKRKMSEFPDPITFVAREYDRRPLTVQDIASELGLPNDPKVAQRLGFPVASEFQTIVKFSNRLQQYGLAPLAQQDGSLPRDVWENAFQRTARELKLGVPLDTN